MNRLKRILYYADVLLRWMIISTLALALASITIQVFCRFVLENALSWPEEASRYLVVWSMFLALYYVHLERSHIIFSFFIYQCSPRTQTLISLILNILIGLFLILMFIGGISMVLGVINISTIALQIPKAIPYSIIPLSSFLMLGANTRLIIEDVTKLKGLSKNVDHTKGMVKK